MQIARIAIGLCPLGALMLACRPDIAEDHTAAVAAGGALPAPEAAAGGEESEAAGNDDSPSGETRCSVESNFVPRTALSVGPRGSRGDGLLATYSDGGTKAREGPINFGPHRSGPHPSWYPANDFADASAPRLWRTIWGLGVETLAGYLRSPVTGLVELSLGCDDYCSIELDGRLTAASDETAGASGTLELVEGEWYPLNLVYANRLGSNYFSFVWRCPDEPLRALAADAETLALFHFDESLGSTVNDAGPQALHGTADGAAWTTGPIDGALALPSRASVTLPFSEKLMPTTNQITVEARVLVSSQVAGGRHQIFDFHDIYGLAIEAGYGWFGVMIDNALQSLTTPEKLSPGWHRLAGTYDGKAMRLWVDGGAVAVTRVEGLLSSVNLSTIAQCSSPTIGKGCIADSWLETELDELRISSVVRY
jgi:hypothetical protein